MNNISIKKATKKEIKQFGDGEWKKADIEHYGRPIHWVEKEFILKAVEGGRIIGYVKFKYESGVIYVRNLIVAEDRRGEGIGRKLMEQVERTARQLRAHKIYLSTGEKWRVRKFYEKLGYKKTADLPKHYFKVDFVIYSKMI